MPERKIGIQTNTQFFVPRWVKYLEDQFFRSLNIFSTGRIYQTKNKELKVIKKVIKNKHTVLYSSKRIKWNMSLSSLLWIKSRTRGDSNIFSCLEMSSNSASKLFLLNVITSGEKFPITTFFGNGNDETRSGNSWRSFINRSKNSEWRRSMRHGCSSSFWPFV